MLISQHQIFCHAYSSPNSNLWCKQECDVGPKAGIFRTEGLAMAAPAMKPMKPMGLVRPNQLRGLSEKGDIFPPTIITIRWWFQRLFLAFSTPFFFTNEWFKHHLEYNDYIIISQKTQPSLKEPQKNCQGTWTKSVGRILVGTLVSDLDIFNLRPCLGGKSMLMLRDVARCWSVNSVRPFWSIRKCNFDAASSKNLVRSACIFFLASKAKVSVFCKKCQTLWNQTSHYGKVGRVTTKATKAAKATKGQDFTLCSYKSLTSSNGSVRPCPNEPWSSAVLVCSHQQGVLIDDVQDESRWSEGFCSWVERDRQTWSDWICVSLQAHCRLLWGHGPPKPCDTSWRRWCEKSVLWTVPWLVHRWRCSESYVHQDYLKAKISLQLVSSDCISR